MLAKFFGIIFFIIGAGLLVVGLCGGLFGLQIGGWGMVWRAVLGFLFCVASYLMVEFAGYRGY